MLAAAFSESDARPRWVPNHEILGISSLWVNVGAFREERLKPALYGLGGVLALLALLLGLRSLAVRQGALTARVATGAAWSLLIAGIIGGLVAVSTPGLLDFMVGRRLTLDANHFWIGVAVLAAALVTFLMRPPAEAPLRRISQFLTRRLGPLLLVLSALAGVLMVLKVRWLEGVTRLSYTAFDLGLVLLASSAVMLLALRLSAVGELGSRRTPYRVARRRHGPRPDSARFEATLGHDCNPHRGLPARPGRDRGPFAGFRSLQGHPCWVVGQLGPAS